MALCECGCGQNVSTAKSNGDGYIKGQFHRFCKGHRSKTLHGVSRTVEWHAWYDAKNRCTNEDHQHWLDYGGRGIKFLFTSFEQWFGELGSRPTQEHSVDRINNDGNYEPGNVRWATKLEQQNNRRQKKKEFSDDLEPYKFPNNPVAKSSTAVLTSTPGAIACPKCGCQSLGANAAQAKRCRKKNCNCACHQ